MALAEPGEMVDGRSPAQWPELRKQIALRAARRSLSALWPSGSRGGEFLLWGFRAANGDWMPATAGIARIAAGRTRGTAVDLEDAAEKFLELAGHKHDSLRLVAEGLVWAYAMPEMASGSQSLLRESLWWNVLEELQNIHRTVIEECSAERFERLLGAELGGILAWRLVDLPSCKALGPTALEGIQKWFDESGESVGAAMRDGGRWSRMVLGSALRSRRLAARMQRRIGLRRSGAAIDLASWVAALLRRDGTSMLGSQSAAREDLAEEGLLAVAASELGGKALQSAVAASLGKTTGQGRLAWHVEMPETAWFDEAAKVAVMLPDWDVRRGRTAVDYSGSNVRIEVSGGKRPVIQGDWTCTLFQDGVPVRPTGSWTDLCWYCDDDVNYLELERPFEGNMKVQRHILLLREDRTLLLADAVLGGDQAGELSYQSQWSLPPNVYIEQEKETREFWLVDQQRRALVLPIGLSEWRVGPSAGDVRFIDVGENPGSPSLGEMGLRKAKGKKQQASPVVTTSSLAVQASMRGRKAFFMPMWIDLDRRRMTAARTWRKLAVAEKLGLTPSHEAVAFRVHVGKEQWLCYRSLSGAANRTFMGKNLISEFFCARFDAEDGAIEELIAVDEQAE